MQRTPDHPFAPVVGLLLAACAGLLALPWQDRTARIAAQEVVPPGPRAALEDDAWEGVSSCSASACHGGSRPRAEGPIWGNEYTVWATVDPHRRAYQVLHGEQSKRILKNLYGAAHWADASAVQQRSCLACHATAAEVADDERRERFLSDGVGCESCHGPAGDWLGPHTTAAWDAGPAPRRDEFIERGSFHDVRDLLPRASTCVGCHVGDRDREVHHDLIAAGHPRLFFEFGAYLDRLPKHWREKDASPDFEARVWAVGSVATARQALELLEHRARTALENIDSSGAQEPLRWPEFAEYSCYACHHELLPAGKNRQRANPSVPPGTLPWGHWHYPLVRELAIIGAPDVAPLDLTPVGTLVDRIDRAMTRLTPTPTRLTSILGDIETLKPLLHEWAVALNESRLDDERIDALLRQLAANHQESSDWDSTVQLYLALYALHLAGQQAGMYDSSDAALAELRGTLRFEPEFDSPRSNDPPDVEALLEGLLHELHAPEGDAP